jgi:hypothetical protein
MADQAGAPTVWTTASVLAAAATWADQHPSRAAEALEVMLDQVGAGLGSVLWQDCGIAVITVLHSRYPLPTVAAKLRALVAKEGTAAVAVALQDAAQVAGWDAASKGRS